MAATSCGVLLLLLFVLLLYGTFCDAVAQPSVGVEVSTSYFEYANVTAGLSSYGYLPHLQQEPVTMQRWHQTPLNTVNTITIPAGYKPPLYSSNHPNEATASSAAAPPSSSSSSSGVWCQSYAAPHPSVAFHSFCILDGVQLVEDGWRLRTHAAGLPQATVEQYLGSFVTPDSAAPRLSTLPAEDAPPCLEGASTDRPVVFAPATRNTFHMVHDIVGATFAALREVGYWDSRSQVLRGGTVVYDAGDPGPIGAMRQELLQRLVVSDSAEAAAPAPAAADEDGEAGESGITLRVWPQPVVGACFRRVLIGIPAGANLYFPANARSIATWGDFLRTLTATWGLRQTAGPAAIVSSRAGLRGDFSVVAGAGAGATREPLTVPQREDTGDPRPPPMPAVVTIIERRDRSKRYIDNLAELAAVASSKGLEVRVVAIEDLSVAEQVELLQRTTVLVGATGAGLTNVLWLPPGAALVLVWPDMWPIRYRHPYFEPWEQMLALKGGITRVLMARGDMATMHVSSVDFAYTLDDVLRSAPIHTGAGGQQATWRSEPPTGTCTVPPPGAHMVTAFDQSQVALFPADHSESSDPGASKGPAVHANCEFYQCGRLPVWEACKRRHGEFIPRQNNDSGAAGSSSSSTTPAVSQQYVPFPTLDHTGTNHALDQQQQQQQQPPQDEQHSAGAASATSPPSQGQPYAAVHSSGPSLAVPAVLLGVALFAALVACWAYLACREQVEPSSVEERGMLLPMTGLTPSRASPRPAVGGAAASAGARGAIRSAVARLHRSTLGARRAKHSKQQPRTKAA